mmetsp:Transcript_29003/g.27975  ORF Transcript_29003/g.27975 Transcript_29003/m.27975 type:complete len:153 (+) Transcript_29003:1336-1794(+)
MEAKKFLIFTFSSEIKVQREDIKKACISDYSQEEEFIKSIKHFYQSEKEKRFILSLNLEDQMQHLSYVKFMIDKQENEEQCKKKRMKHFLVVIMLKRNRAINLNKLKIFDGWEQLMIDDLNTHSDLQFDICDKTSLEIVMDSRYFSFENCLY